MSTALKAFAASLACSALAPPALWFLGDRAAVICGGAALVMLAYAGLAWREGRQPAGHQFAWDPERPMTCAECDRDFGNPVHPREALR